MGLYGFCVFIDLVLVFEVVLVMNGGLGWCGKYMLLLDCDVGLMFFFGEIFVDLLFFVDLFVELYCGNCMCCIDVCFM